ncbi:yrdC domain-containing protein, mitochondrial isoform X1 [Iris pallida]|uniref:Threonylcarbamoyl-AMP synthase n=1 Tax=Iris pallida TaxID=29817 RepID=A0AAX6FSB2_IRIPA|nr:yrdC domain-containing protein, mitochondrial isoform X1 [Iris pallida]
MTLLHPFSVRRLFHQRSPQFASIIWTGQRSHLCHLRKMSQVLNKCSMDFCKIGGVVLPASEDHIDEAIGAIRAGSVIAVPTDTLYGFACDACSAQGVKEIYEIKGRKQTSPLAICVADVSDISRFASVDHLPYELLDNLLPGPVTVVLPRGESSIAEESLNPGLESIGVRVPEHGFVRAIARGLGSALALTSANLSGQPSSVSTQDFESLWRYCVYVFDGGLLPGGLSGSTVVDLTEPRRYKILRPGSAREETLAVLQRFSFEEAS